MTIEASPACPIPNTHRRLHECHRLWHATAEAYADPEAFRTNLNALLQALRNVTFVLQNEKRAVPDFDDWYGIWRETLSQDGVLRWLVEARNHVVKEGDLETFSTATAAIHASWDEPEEVTFEVPPLIQTVAVVARLSEQEVPDDVRESGFLRVERRWVARTLPEWELLDALGHCYGMLALLIRDAHRQAGVPMHAVEVSGKIAHELSSELAGGRLPCMVASEDIRTVVLNLRTGQVIQTGLVPHRRDEAALERAARRYPAMASVRGPRSNDALDWAEYYMEQAKIVLARDKWHAQYAFLFHEDGSRDMLTAAPSDQQEKYLFMKDVAAHVQRFGFTGIVFTADAWTARPEDVPPGKRAGEVPQRTEVIGVTAMRSDGAVRHLSTPYSRRFGRIRFGETFEDEGTPFFLAPVMRLWGLPVPSQRAAEEELDQLWREAHSVDCSDE
jgi:hypothetical protein